jgi:hypothetical protein
MGRNTAKSSSSLVDLPIDELMAYGRELGLKVKADAARGELLRRIRERQELLVELDRDALLDIVVWARVPVRQSSTKEDLAKHIAIIDHVAYDGLSERGLRAFARLRDIQAAPGAARATLERRLRRQEGLWAKYRRHRRRAVGSLIGKVLEAPTQGGDYKFLPEEDGGPSLRESIQQAGVVGGIAQQLRGAADEYVHQKLDEIEHRIDRKLDEIDARLAEWRDREIRNRLRIVKITLIAAIVVAFVSLGYDYLKTRNRPNAEVAVSRVDAE